MNAPTLFDLGYLAGLFIAESLEFILRGLGIGV